MPVLIRQCMDGYYIFSFLLFKSLQARQNFQEGKAGKRRKVITGIERADFARLSAHSATTSTLAVNWKIFKMAYPSVALCQYGSPSLSLTAFRQLP